VCCTIASFWLNVPNNSNGYKTLKPYLAISAHDLYECVSTLSFSSELYLPVQATPNLCFGGSSGDALGALRTDNRTLLRWCPLEKQRSKNSDILNRLLQEYAKNDATRSHELIQELWQLLPAGEYKSIPQRTEGWHDLRPFLPISGSNFFSALMCGAPGVSRKKFGKAQRAAKRPAYRTGELFISDLIFVHARPQRY
jgi:hypothetical protein